MAYLTNGTLNYDLTKDAVCCELQLTYIEDRNKMDPTYPDPNDSRFTDPTPVFTILDNLLYRDGVSIGKIYNNKTGKVVEITETTETGFKYKDTEEDALINKDNSIVVVEKLTGLKGEVISKPNNIITYEASEKLTETTSNKSSGLHTNKFNTTIVSHTFENGVGTIEFEEDVTTIYKYAFYNCGNMTSIDLPNSVTSICIDGNALDGAFQYCNGLTSITIPNSVTTIGKCTFMNSGLTSIDISDSVTTIGDGAFQYCNGLTSVTIPSGVTSIGRTFGSCANLASITVDSNNTIYDSRNNCNAIIETATNTLIQGCKNTIIPEGITSIGESSFFECSELTSITIPSSVTTIGGDAFHGCRGLTSINIPSGVTSIGDDVFNLCTGLTSVTIEATTPPTVGSSTFLNTNNCPIYVHAASVETYKAASNWSSYASRIQAIQ